MCRGRFRDAFAMTDQLLSEAPENDYLLRGDVVRLQHLGYRFALDWDESERALETAADLYRRAGTIVEPANIATNRAELLIWTDPGSALEASVKAIEIQTEMGAQHELGKAYTALAVAQTRLGMHERASASFRAAAEALERARYRSGRARAELFRAFLHARTERPDLTVTSVRWAVRELVAAEVYPTLIVMAKLLLDAIGTADEEVVNAACDARNRIDSLDVLTALERRGEALVTAMLEVR